MKINLLLILILSFTIFTISAQTSDSSQVARPTISADTTGNNVPNDDDANFPSTDSLPKLPKYFYSIGLDGTTSSGNVNRQLLNVRLTLNHENPKSIWGFFTSPKFQYGTNSDVLQERELFVDFNNTFFYSQSDIYGLFFGNFEQSNLRKINTRTNVGIGIGWRILGGKKSPKSNVKLSISNAFVHEKTDFIIKQDREIFRNSTRFRLSADIIPNQLSFNSTIFFQPSLNDNYLRWNSLTTLSYKVGKHIAILASLDTIYENFNIIGIQNSQVNATIGLTYSGSN